MQEAAAEVPAVATPAVDGAAGAPPSAGKALLGSHLCSDSWNSKAPLKHRRTLILFNELHAQNDGLEFRSWLSPEETTLWQVKDESNVKKDTDATAIIFMHNLSSHIWLWVLSEWRTVIEQCSVHIGQVVSVSGNFLLLLC
jgi:hypothetical protein